MTRRQLATVLATVLAVVLAAACTRLEDPETRQRDSLPERKAEAPASTSTSLPSAGQIPLFYVTGGKVHVSEQASSAGKAITDGPYDDQPAPSPDGKQVAFVRKAAADVGGGELWVTNTDGSEARQLVHPELLPRTQGTPEPLVRSPRWSPAGDKIAFIVPGLFDGGPLVVVDAKSGGQPEAESPPLVSDIFAWSPDGTRIAWIAPRSDVSPVDIGVTDANTGQSKTWAAKTNASGLTWINDATVLFANGNVPASPGGPSAMGFEVAVGGLYQVTENGTVGTITAEVATHFANPAVLSEGAIAYTTGGADLATQTLIVWRLDLALTKLPEEIVNNALLAYPATAWSPADELAYLVDFQRRSLTVVPPGGGDPRHIDDGVTSFAWPEASSGTGAAAVPPQ